MMVLDAPGTARFHNEGAAGPQFSALLVEGLRLSYCFEDARVVREAATFTRAQLHEIARTVQGDRTIRKLGFRFARYGDWLDITHDYCGGNIALRRDTARQLIRMLSHLDDDPEGL